MKLFVTGGAGFIGSNFILYWLSHHGEDKIINFDKLTYAGNLENLKEAEDNPHYSFIHGDICNKNKVEQAVAGADIVVNFAAETHVDRSINEPALFVKTNVLGTQVLLEASLKAKIKRFHHISTDEVFGSLELNSPSRFSERTIYNPRNPYSASKAGSDHLVRSYFHTYGLPVTLTNCSNNFGPFQFPEKLIPLAITNLLEGKKVPVYGDGLNVRDWLYVEDHCRAIDLVLEKGRVGETYCVSGTDNDISNIEVIKKILMVMKKPESLIEFVKDRPGHDRRYTIDSTKAKTELGWQSGNDFESRLRKTIDWYKENETWWRSVKSGQYQDYYQKQYGTPT